MNYIHSERLYLVCFEDRNIEWLFKPWLLNHFTYKQRCNLVERSSNFKISLFLWLILSIFPCFVFNHIIIRETCQNFATPKFVQTVMNKSITIPVCRCHNTKVFLNCNDFLPSLSIPNNSLSFSSRHKAFAIFSEGNLGNRPNILIQNMSNLLFFQVDNPEWTIVLACLN